MSDVENFLGSPEDMIAIQESKEIGPDGKVSSFPSFGFVLGKPSCLDTLCDTANGLVKKAKNLGVGLAFLAECYIASFRAPSAYQVYMDNTPNVLVYTPKENMLSMKGMLLERLVGRREISDQYDVSCTPKTISAPPKDMYAAIMRSK